MPRPRDQRLYFELQGKLTQQEVDYNNLTSTNPKKFRNWCFSGDVHVALKAQWSWVELVALRIRFVVFFHCFTQEFVSPPLYLLLLLC